MHIQPVPVSGLYIHWPFCPYRCFFCPFVALAGQDEYMPAYNKALQTEIRDYFDKHPPTAPIETIFIGGGTPSSWPPTLLLDTLAILSSAITCVENHEITLEVNPGTITQEKIDAWRAAGITRISMGVQSLNEQVLARLNRHHTIEDVHRFMHELKGNFRSLSIDLILGLPGVSPSEWRDYIDRVIAWPIDHLSVYFLTVHEDTRLYYGIQQKQFILPTDESMVDMYLWTIDQLQKAGFEQYEISNFARNGHQSRHNQLYWNRKPYQGFGLGACSFDGIHRTQNEKNLTAYLARTAAHQSPVVQCEKLSSEQERLEKIMLGIRQNQGISIDMLIEHTDNADHINDTIQNLAQAQLIKRNKNNIALTPRGRVLENEIIVRLTQKTNL